MYKCGDINALRGQPKAQQVADAGRNEAEDVGRSGKGARTSTGYRDARVVRRREERQENRPRE